MKRYIKDNFGTGFLSPYFNFVLTLVGVLLALSAVVWRLSCLQ